MKNLKKLTIIITLSLIALSTAMLTACPNSNGNGTGGGGAGFNLGEFQRYLTADEINNFIEYDAGEFEEWVASFLTVPIRKIGYLSGISRTMTTTFNGEAGELSITQQEENNSFAFYIQNNIVVYAYGNTPVGLGDNVSDDEMLHHVMVFGFATSIMLLQYAVGSNLTTIARHANGYYVRLAGEGYSLLLRLDSKRRLVYGVNSDTDTDAEWHISIYWYDYKTPVINFPN